jgi:hypothetical protein
MIDIVKPIFIIIIVIFVLLIIPILIILTYLTAGILIVLFSIIRYIKKTIKKCKNQMFLSRF